MKEDQKRLAIYGRSPRDPSDYDDPNLLDSGGQYISANTIVEIQSDNPFEKKFNGLIGITQEDGDREVSVHLAPNQGTWGKKIITVDTDDLIEHEKFKLEVVDLTDTRDFPDPYRDTVLLEEIIEFDNLKISYIKALLNLRPGEHKFIKNVWYRRLRSGEKAGDTPFPKSVMQIIRSRRASSPFSPGDRFEAMKVTSNMLHPDLNPTKNEIEKALKDAGHSRRQHVGSLNFRPGDRIEIQGHAHSKFNGRTGVIQKLVPFTKAYVVLEPNQERILVDVSRLELLPNFRVEVWEETGTRPWVGSVEDLLGSNPDFSGEERALINHMKPGKVLEFPRQDSTFTIRRKASDVPKDVYQRAEKRWVDAIERGGIDKAIRSTEIRLDKIAPGSSKALGVAQFLTDWVKDHPFLLGPAHKSKIKALVQSAKKHGKNASSTEEDNSWGLGYYPLPPHLLSLSRFISGFKMVEAEHKVWPKEGVHMLTIRMTPQFSIMGNDLRRLLQLGLIRIQSNSPGKISFYFDGKPLLAE